MRNRLLKAIFVATAFILLNGEQSRSQSDGRKFEASGVISLIRFRGIQSVDPVFIISEVVPIQKTSVTGVGFGGRLSYNITEKIAVEGELSYLPGSTDEFDDFVEGGRKIQGLAGIKAGGRKEGYGLFVKIRPGFVRFSSLIDCPQGSSPFARCVTPSKVYLALDLGGVVEFYPSSRAVLRFDEGSGASHWRCILSMLIKKLERMV